MSVSAAPGSTPRRRSARTSWLASRVELAERAVPVLAHDRDPVGHLARPVAHHRAACQMDQPRIGLGSRRGVGHCTPLLAGGSRRGVTLPRPPAEGFRCRVSAARDRMLTAASHPGGPVSWQGSRVNWAGTIEPHSVTFTAPGEELPPPGSDPALFEPTPPTGPYDGTAFVFSGATPPIQNPLDPQTDIAIPGPSPQTLNADRPVQLRVAATGRARQPRWFSAARRGAELHVRRARGRQLPLLLHPARGQWNECRH